MKRPRTINVQASKRSDRPRNGNTDAGPRSDHERLRRSLLALALIAAAATGCRRNASAQPSVMIPVVMAGPEVRVSSTQDPGGMPVQFNTPLVPGQAIQVHWGASWYQSRVVAPMPDGTVRIHYLGWPDSADENVTRDRVRIGGVIVPAAPITLPTITVGGANGETSLSSTQDPGGMPAQPDTTLLPGQPIQVRWNSSWFESRVVAPMPDGTVRIHYLGWAATSDENVTRDRIRIGGQIRR
jgi:hypothetical protein